jgi:hypothetical protein
MRDKCGAIAVLPGRLDTVSVAINVLVLSLVVSPRMLVPMLNSVMEEHLRSILEIV